MSTVNGADLLTYLKQAIDLETALLSQKHIINEYDSSAEKRQPACPLYDTGMEPKQSDYTTDSATPYMILGGFLTIVGIAFMYPATLFFNSSESNVGWVFLGMAGLVWGVAYFLGLKDGFDIIKKRKAYTDACSVYASEQEQARLLYSQKTEQYYIDMNEWNRSNEEAHKYLNKPLEETKAVLQTLYAKGVIYPKYQNLPALTSIYEYLITGRCEELTGPHGAYNLYEDEVRKDTVISQLNTVIENLEQIRQNQYMLYEQVKGVQRATQAIAVELNQIKGYTALLTEISTLNLYYNGINAMNSTALAYCRSW